MGIQRLNDRGKSDIHNTRIQSGHEGTNGNAECDPPPPIHRKHRHKANFKQIFDILQGFLFPVEAISQCHSEASAEESLRSNLLIP
jgi:hypothetical protein